MFGIAALATVLSLPRWLPGVFAGGDLALARHHLTGVLTLGLEVGALVGWPLGFHECARRSTERGESRARMALGQSPLRRALALAPTAAALFALAFLSSWSWGARAHAPGRALASVLGSARDGSAATCGARTTLGPLDPLDLARVCIAGATPRFVGSLGPTLAFFADRISTDDALSTLVLERAELIGPAMHLRAETLTVRGLPTADLASPLAPATRGLGLAASALAIATLALFRGFAASLRPRALDWLLVVTAAVATLASLRAIELHALRYAPVLLVSAAVAALATFVALERLVVTLARLRRPLCARRRSTDRAP